MELVAIETLGIPRDVARKFLTRANLSTQEFDGEIKGKYLPLGVIQQLEAAGVYEGDTLYGVDSISTESTPAGTHDGIRDGASSSPQMVRSYYWSESLEELENQPIYNPN